MLAILVVVESGLVQRGTGLNSALGWLWSTCGRMASEGSRECQVLCLGDSQVKHGMVAQVLEDRLGLRTMNLAFSGGQSSTSYFQLRRVLDSGGRPSAVIVDFYPVLLSHGLEENTHRWAQYLSTRECFDLARSARDAHLFAWVMAGRLVPSIRYRQGLRELIAARLKGEQPGPSDLIHLLKRNAWSNKGTLVFEKNPKCWMPDDMDAWVRDGFLRDRVGNEINMAYLGRFLQLAAEHRIPVFWVVPPDHPKIEARKDLEGINGRYTGLLEKALKKYPNLTVLDARHSNYPANVFYDHSHLDREGATTLSADVASQVHRHLADGPAERLIMLPDYRTIAPRVPMEDTRESGVALRDIATRTRR
ncbi:DUF1574 family protein [Singulisphaera sp. PoT]|uniref:DUF1574 family protein n=1 Tax=Singulisphaera sp. PoT TaxID=3411797 RepID=UPI003BF5D7E6